jgi:uncharacterized protein YqfB (UPF0267 family)
MNIKRAIKDAFYLRFKPAKASVPSWYSFRRTHIMPEAEFKRSCLKRLQAVYKYDYFVETGTHLGETPLALQKLFKKIFTIELSDMLYEAAKKKFAPFSNIMSIRGDSAVELRKIIPAIDRPTIFFLDGHYSGAGTALGAKTHPMQEELSAIAQNVVAGHIVVIDDMSDFTASEDNMKLSEVLRALENINPNYKFYSDYDMLFALPHEDIHRQFWREIALPFVVR